MQKKAIKIQMALVDDFEKQYQKAIDMQSKIEAMIIDYNSMSAKIQSDINVVGAEYLKANAKYSELEQMAKNLGVEISSPLKNKKQLILTATKEIDAYAKQMKSSKVKV